MLYRHQRDIIFRRRMETDAGEKETADEQQ